MSTWFSASAVIPQLRVQWALGDTAAAWLTIALQVGFVCGALFSALLNVADLISPRHVILGGSIGAAAASVLLTTADGPTSGIPLRFATGFCLAGCLSTWLQADGDMVHAWARHGAGYLGGGLVTGNGLPHLVNGLGGLEWRIVIYGATIL